MGSLDALMLSLRDRLVDFSIVLTGSQYLIIRHVVGGVVFLFSLVATFFSVSELGGNARLLIAFLPALIVLALAALTSRDSSSRWHIVSGSLLTWRGFLVWYGAALTAQVYSAGGDFVQPGHIRLVYTLMMIASLIFGVYASCVVARRQSLDPVTGQVVAKKHRHSGAPPEKDKLDVVLGKDIDSGREIRLHHKDRYVHQLIMGPTGSGKTSLMVLPQIYQDLMAIKKGAKAGMTVLEPSGDLCESTVNLCRELGIPYVYINPGSKSTARFNPMEGDPSTVAEITRTVLSSFFSTKEPFFAQVQESAARNITLMLKKVKGDDLTLMEVVRVLRKNPTHIDNEYVSKLRHLEKSEENEDLVDYFDSELLGTLKDKYFQFAVGLRQQIEDIGGNSLLRRILNSKSDINLNEHLAHGGVVLVVNTDIGRLGRVGSAFGKFFIMHLQNAVFNRPGSEWDRLPHFLYIDEFALYINRDFEKLLTMGRKYRCSVNLAMQSISQLDGAEGMAYRQTVLNNCRNKILFGGSTGETAKFFEAEFGSDDVVVKSPMFKNKMVAEPVIAEGYRSSEKNKPRFTSTDIQEMEKNHFIYRICIDNQNLPPGMGKAERAKPFRQARVLASSEDEKEEKDNNKGVGLKESFLAKLAKKQEAESEKNQEVYAGVVCAGQEGVTEQSSTFSGDDSHVDNVVGFLQPGDSHANCNQSANERPSEVLAEQGTSISSRHTGGDEASENEKNNVSSVSGSDESCDESHGGSQGKDSDGFIRNTTIVEDDDF